MVNGKDLEIRRNDIKTEPFENTFRGKQIEWQLANETKK